MCAVPAKGESPGIANMEVLFNGDVAIALNRLLL
jgi:hypothetical protein